MVKAAGFVVYAANINGDGLVVEVGHVIIKLRGTPAVRLQIRGK